jgi:metallo-beta-lactamase class B
MPIARRSLIAIAVAALTAVIVATPALAQSRDALARDANLVLTTTKRALKWEERADPLRIAGPITFVGTRGLGVWLITTRDGHILLNTALPTSGQMIIDAIRKAGFAPEDIRVLIQGHAHVEHVGTHAYFKELSKGKVAVMDADVPAMEDGGKSDFQYGSDIKVMGFPHVKVDHVLRDGETVRLGDVVMTAIHTPGHTRGATTWVTTVTDGGKAYTVVWPDGGAFNPGYRMTGAGSYPGIGDDYRRTLHRLEMLKPDIWLGGHNETFDLDGKRARAAAQGVQAFVDPEGYRRFVAKQRRAFEDEVDEELRPPPPPPAASATPVRGGAR